MPEVVNTSILNYTATEDPNDTRPVVVDVNEVSMSFNMASETLTNLKEYFIKLMKRELFFEEFTALDHVSFQVRKGDVYGIMGTNGSGKSTLLKIMAGVLEPTHGTCEVRGNIAPLIELGAGFDTELSARENIYLNGALLGYSHDFIDEHFTDIVEFAEVEKFLDMPMKNYSSGMVSRIAFAIATVIVPEILLVDEVLSVGDLMFQRKCEQRIMELIEEHGVTVLIVSHSDGQIARLCNKAVWIEKGHVRCIGPAADISTIYATLGGRTGSAASEARIFDCMTRAMDAPAPNNIDHIDFSPVAKGIVEMVRRGWTDAFDTVILVHPGIHTQSMIFTPISVALGAPILTYDIDDPALETQYFLLSVKPKNIVIVHLKESDIAEDELQKCFPWALNIRQFYAPLAYDLAWKALGFGREVGAGCWPGGNDAALARVAGAQGAAGEVCGSGTPSGAAGGARAVNGAFSTSATLIDFRDNSLGMAVCACAGRARSFVSVELFDKESLARDCAQRLAAEKFTKVYICGPSFPQEYVHFFEEAGLSVRLVARKVDCENNNFIDIVQAYDAEIAQAEGVAADGVGAVEPPSVSAVETSAAAASDAGAKLRAPIKEVMIDAFTQNSWYSIQSAPAYLAHVGGVMVLQDTTDLDSMVATLDFCEAVAAQNEGCRVIHLTSASGLTETDIKLAANILEKH